jgi:hypothetical protein
MGDDGDDSTVISDSDYFDDDSDLTVQEHVILSDEEIQQQKEIQQKEQRRQEEARRKVEEEEKVEAKAKAEAKVEADASAQAQAAKANEARAAAEEASARAQVDQTGREALEQCVSGAQDGCQPQEINTPLNLSDQNESNQEKAGQNVAGMAVGALVLCALFVLLLSWLCRCRRKKPAEKTPKSNQLVAKVEQAKSVNELDALQKEIDQAPAEMQDAVQQKWDVMRLCNEIKPAVAQLASSLQHAHASARQVGATYGVPLCKGADGKASADSVDDGKTMQLLPSPVLDLVPQIRLGISSWSNCPQCASSVLQGLEQLVGLAPEGVQMLISVCSSWEGGVSSPARNQGEWVQAWRLRRRQRLSLLRQVQRMSEMCNAMKLGGASEDGEENAKGKAGEANLEFSTTLLVWSRRLSEQQRVADSLLAALVPKSVHETVQDTDELRWGKELAGDGADLDATALRALCFPSSSSSSSVRRTASATTTQGAACASPSRASSAPVTEAERENVAEHARQLSDRVERLSAILMPPRSGRDGSVGGGAPASDSRLESGSDLQSGRGGGWTPELGLAQHILAVWRRWLQEAREMEASAADTAAVLAASPNKAARGGPKMLTDGAAEPQANSSGGGESARSGGSGDSSLAVASDESMGSCAPPLAKSSMQDFGELVVNLERAGMQRQSSLEKATEVLAMQHNREISDENNRRNTAMQIEANFRIEAMRQAAERRKMRESQEHEWEMQRATQQEAMDRDQEKWRMVKERDDLRQKQASALLKKQAEEATKRAEKAAEEAEAARAEARWEREETRSQEVRTTRNARQWHLTVFMLYTNALLVLAVVALLVWDDVIVKHLLNPCTQAEAAEAASATAHTGGNNQESSSGMGSSMGWAMSFAPAPLRNLAQAVSGMGDAGAAVGSGGGWYCQMIATAKLVGGGVGLLISYAIFAKLELPSGAHYKLRTALLHSHCPPPPFTSFKIQSVRSSSSALHAMPCEMVCSHWLQGYTGRPLAWSSTSVPTCSSALTAACTGGITSAVAAERARVMSAKLIG